VLQSAETLFFAEKGLGILASKFFFKKKIICKIGTSIGWGGSHLQWWDFCCIDVDTKPLLIYISFDISCESIFQLYFFVLFYLGEVNPRAAMYQRPISRAVGWIPVGFGRLNIGRGYSLILVQRHSAVLFF
jgi:hypothetical protein